MGRIGSLVAAPFTGGASLLAMPGGPLGNTGSTFRKGSEQSGQAAGLANQLGQVGGDITAQQSALRQITMPQLGTFAGTGQLPTPFNQILGQGAQELGTQGSAARQSILDTGARGGGLEAALTQAQAQRMQGLDALRAQLGQGLYGQALQAGFNPLGVAALGGGGGLLGQLGGQRIAQNQAFLQGLGQLTGTGIGSAKGGAGGKGSGFGAAGGPWTMANQAPGFGVLAAGA